MNILLFGVVGESVIQNIGKVGLLGWVGAGFNGGNVFTLEHPELLVYNTDHKLGRHQGVFAWGKNVLVES